MRHSSLRRISLAVLILTFCGCSKTSSPSATDSNNSAANPANPSAPNGQGNAPAQPASAPTPPPPPPIVVPVGQVLTVTLDQTINSKIANNGDSFVASLAEPVTVDANVALPSGTKVRGTIVTAQSAGKFKGNALLQLTLDSINVNGTSYASNPPSSKTRVRDAASERQLAPAVVRHSARSWEQWLEAAKARRLAH